jgi:hypothetical protein
MSCLGVEVSEADYTVRRAKIFPRRPMRLSHERDL